MRRKLLPLIAVLGAAALALAVATVGQAGISDVFDSSHDLGSAGNPTCKQCHIPHDAQGAYLWARTPGGPLPESATLCYSCHDGSVALSGTYIWAPGTVNHRMGDEGHGAMMHYGDGYCLSCHDAHDGTWRFTKDVMREGKPPNPYNAQMCLACHGLPYFDPSQEKNHAWEITMSPPNLPSDQTFDPSTGNPGTRLWDSATLREPVPAGSAGDITCLTCHAVHGAVTANDTLNSMAVSEDTTSHSPICENCHQ